MDLIKQSLSDDDIRNFFKSKIKIVKYSDLKDMQSIDDLLEPHMRCIILFEISAINSGHWTLLQQCYDTKKKKPYILFFDSYGYSPENEISVISPEFRKYSDQERGYLLKLLYEQPQEVHYNNYRLQKIKKNINTCGKYCCVKGKYPFIDEHEFQRLLRSTQFEPDYLICLLYERLYKK
jgi:hypothetical protein